jgi:hypothetical protein
MTARARWTHIKCMAVFEQETSRVDRVKSEIVASFMFVTDFGTFFNTGCCNLLLKIVTVIVNVI